MSNKYFFRGKISDEKFRTVLRLFCLDVEAKKTTEFAGLNQNTVNNIYYKLRERIAQLCETESPFTNGEVELDESYFGARRVRGIRGRGAKGKIPVFGMLKRGDKVYTQIVKNCSINELMPIRVIPPFGAYGFFYVCVYSDTINCKTEQDRRFVVPCKFCRADVEQNAKSASFHYTCFRVTISE